MRSAIFLLGFFLYLLVGMGLPQRLIVLPYIRLFPRRRDRVLGAWIHLQARATRFLLRVGAGVHFRTEGTIPPGDHIVVMNHQSVLDVVIALCAVKGSLAIIPVRTRYRRGLPGISPFLRAAAYPFITQRRASADADLAEIERGVQRAAEGHVTFFIFPEGHRTRTGEIGPFMTRGLTMALKRCRQPVCCMVGDGMWRVRTLADVFTGLAGVVATARVIGPFAPPAEEQDIPGFIALLRDRMIATLREFRAGTTSSTQSDAIRQHTAV